ISGGTIANKNGGNGSTTGGIGIYLNNTKNPSFSWMLLNNFQHYAIGGSTVTGLPLANSAVNGSNGSTPADGVRIVSFNNLTGSATVSDTSISGGFEDNVRIVNTTGTLNRVTFSNVTIGANSTAAGNDGIIIEGQGSSTVNVSIVNSTFTSARGDL